MEDLRAKLLEALDFEDVWLNFDTGTFVSDAQIREMIRVGDLNPDRVSSRPDIFPVFGDLAQATKLVRAATKAVLKSGDSVDYECHKGVAGFKNPGNSCFMDSTLMAMFFLVDSPFYDGIFNSVVSGGDAQCSRDPAENKRLKEEVKTLIKSDVERIIKGEVGYKCVKLRTLIGKTCRGNDEDMSRDTHDAAMFFRRVMEIVNYEPCQWRFTTFRETTPEDKNSYVTGGSTLEVTTTLGNPHITWPGMWGQTSDYNDIGKYEVVTVREFVSADVIVVQVNRSEMEFKMVKGVKIPTDVVHNNRPVTVDRELHIPFTNGTHRTFVLRAAVYAPYFGHYAAILKCDENWLNYDDLNASKPYDNNIVGDDDVETILTTKTTLLFYY
jgi:hypothetical protein